MNPVFRSRSERGAILVHAAVLLLALTAFSALVFDLGVMFVGRGQAQNAADAGALAAATSLAFTISNNQAQALTLARSGAIAAARQNLVWGQAPDIRAADVTFVCPAGVAGTTCIQANVFRTTYGRAGGNPLPTFFANIVGIGEQGTKATATARMLARSGTADCVKPWAIPDLWTDNLPLPPTTFSRYVQAGPGAGNLLPPPRDVYRAPNGGGTGTGYELPRDFGTPRTLSLGLNGDYARPDHYYPVMISAVLTFQNAIEQCATTSITPGMLLNFDAVGNADGQTGTAVGNLIARDAAATWDPAANGGRGAPSGGCMAAGTCARSPRLVAVPVFSPDEYDAGPRTSMVLRVTNVVGFWIQSLAGNNVVGYVTQFPAVSLAGPVFTEPSSFVRTVGLIR